MNSIGRCNAGERPGRLCALCVSVVQFFSRFSAYGTIQVNTYACNQTSTPTRTARAMLWKKT